MVKEAARRDFLSGLDLFSGYGGITLALQSWVRPLAYCEIDRYAQAVLLSRMSDNQLPRAPIWDDIKTLSGKEFQEKIDIIYGGFPCQNISVGGNGKGLAGEQSSLFFEILRLAEEIQPKFLFLENVPAIRARGLSQIGQELAKAGYDCRWCTLSAADVGAPHKRERWFLLANSHSFGSWNNSSSQQKRGKVKARTEAIQSENHEAHEYDAQQVCEPLAYSKSEGLEGLLCEHGNLKSGYSIEEFNECSSASTKIEQNPWQTQSMPNGVVDGTPFRVDRVKCCGNGVVPQQAKKAFEMLLGL